MNTKIIKLDINKRLYETAVAKQGDTESRFLLFNLLDGAVPFNLTNRSVRVYGIKPDNEELFNDLIINNAEKGYCTLELTNQVLAVPGIVKLEVVITEGTKKLSSIPFNLEVIKSVNNENAVVSTNEFTALLNGLASLNEYDNYKNEIEEARDGEAKLGDNIQKIKDTKVDKVDGKQLSTNDFDNRLKQLVEDWNTFKANGGKVSGDILLPRGVKLCGSKNGVNNPLIYQSDVDNGRVIVGSSGQTTQIASELRPEVYYNKETHHIAFLSDYAILQEEVLLQAENQVDLDYRVTNIELGLL